MADDEQRETRDQRGEGEGKGRGRPTTGPSDLTQKQRGEGERPRGRPTTKSKPSLTRSSLPVVAPAAVANLHRSMRTLVARSHLGIFGLCWFWHFLFWFYLYLKVVDFVVYLGLILWLILRVSGFRFGMGIPGPRRRRRRGYKNIFRRGSRRGLGTQKISAIGNGSTNLQPHPTPLSFLKPSFFFLFTFLLYFFICSNIIHTSLCRNYFLKFKC